MSRRLHPSGGRSRYGSFSGAPRIPTLKAARKLVGSLPRRVSSFVKGKKS